MEAGFRFFALGPSIMWDPWYILAPQLRSSNTCHSRAKHYIGS